MLWLVVLGLLGMFMNWYNLSGSISIVFRWDRKRDSVDIAPPQERLSHVPLELAQQSAFKPPSAKLLKPKETIPIMLPVCAFANAESVETAMQTAAQWPHFPFWFSVWGDRDLKSYKREDRIHMIPAANSTHAEGWELAVARAKTGGYLCEYFFAMDDDLVWNVNDSVLEMNKFSSMSPSVTEVMMNYLQEYRPAITGFPWPWGDTHERNLMLMNAKYAGKNVQPLTGFDNGCMIFHHTVVDFFVPVHLGGGFKPLFIVQHTFQNFFAPFLFRGNAIRFNGVSYVNPPVQRHPYDPPYAYKNHFLPASRCLHRHWGVNLPPENVDWEVEVGSPPYRFSDMHYISTFFNISHSAIKDHPAIRQQISAEDIDQIMSVTSRTLTEQDYCASHAYELLISKSQTDTTRNRNSFILRV